MHKLHMCDRIQSICEKIFFFKLPEVIRKKVQSICDEHTCSDCSLNGWTQTVWHCDWLRGCCVGTCPVCNGAENYKPVGRCH